VIVHDIADFEQKATGLRKVMALRSDNVQLRRFNEDLAMNMAMLRQERSSLAANLSLLDRLHRMDASTLSTLSKGMHDSQASETVLRSAHFTLQQRLKNEQASNSALRVENRDLRSKERCAEMGLLLIGSFALILFGVAVAGKLRRRLRNRSVAKESSLDAPDEDIVRLRPSASRSDRDNIDGEESVSLTGNKGCSNS
jgi:hypothetical protein